MGVAARSRRPVRRRRPAARHRPLGARAGAILLGVVGLFGLRALLAHAGVALFAARGVALAAVAGRFGVMPLAVHLRLRQAGM